MSRFERLREVEDSPDIDMSPMIDCVFIMLIFFIVATTFIEESGVDVEKPRAATQANLERESIYIALTAEGEVVYAGKQIGITGVRALVSRMVEKDPGMPVVIEADLGAESGKLIKIIDEAKLAGATKVSMATKLSQN
ncbi:ExbD/TolR family protein [Mucisphaera calidilacus]|uniref:Biopolymer transport protein ExbD n=1 Tax=Mucisphaera calidilacus TaxID=2527982 RepID=A0A518BUD8_9BACT|nr:biopolymer transporter ExbD [Mucisphaera calidilacus]QDU70602.1 biopolymer transport protein ExbD [Mucisphaera calidilacus]